MKNDFEQQRRTWSSGFLGYRDNSPEAKLRRFLVRSKKLRDRLINDFMIFGRASYHSDEISKLIEK